MLTKAIIQSVDYTKNICRVRIPLFENASRNTTMIEADAQFSIVPGVYNSYKTGDIVFIGFEENKMELPIILGKLFVSATDEASSYRGNVSGNSLDITDTAQLPYTTIFNYSNITQNKELYQTLNTPKKLADSIITIQRAVNPSYQTIIKLAGYDLYLKTTADFTYSAGSSDEPLYRLGTALEKNQINGSVIPLDMVVSDQGIISAAAVQVLEITATNISFKVFVGDNNFTVNKADINEISSTVVQY